MKLATKHILLLLLLATLLQAHSTSASSCPVSSPYLTLHHGHLNVAVGSTVSLQVGVDSLCYDYSLPSPFQQRPGVAIAISRFEANPSQDLFFSIQIAKATSYSLLSFLVRTQWKYTQWNLMTVNFFAEDHVNYEASSFMVDTTALAGCSASKEVNVILPFKHNQFAAVGAVTFLNGFEISTQGYQVGTAPFEIQVMKIGILSSGVSLRITATTSTKIFNVFVSILAWSAQAQYVLGDTYEYNSFAPVKSLSSGAVSLSYGSTHDMFGFSGFIVQNGQFSISGTYTNGMFSFISVTSFQYLSFSYFFISMPDCADCPGYPYPYNGVCQVSCPAGSYLSNG